MRPTQQPDWNELFAVAMAKTSAIARSSRGRLADWNQKRAERFRQRTRASRYTQEFLRRADIPPGSTVLDVGAGPGTLTLPIARQGKQVTALDMSQTMLGLAQESARAMGLTNITYVAKPWQAVRPGKDVGPHDVVICSRSIHLVSAQQMAPGASQGGSTLRWNLAQALTKMNQLARKKVIVTSWAPYVSQIEDEICRLLGKAYTPAPDYIYVYNVLYQMGIYANVQFWAHERMRTFSSVTAAVEDFSWLLSVADDGQKQRMRQYLEKRLVKRGDLLTPPETECRRVAFITWAPP